ncbi:hypothetical protein NE626_10625 [Intestinimonas massiliensis]|uniref:DUF5105 domain-containing protein n=1 Tax=Intestinimonas massiliensis (ex Afouda et al. 2020) TaxID=1673721 RepID=A0ABS9M960_9FIRM|nr:MULTISPECIES: hypothetical protein [Intestinimonas]MCG4526904.1 hypothetical protein [Intestinimonas massiliensis (ex Afouda et al. 2020)]MCI5562944.1 hypothetical protein [Intestinimonas massiliensis (ex Afouda et al. 2020)]MCQ4807276.1 hypothetical protein [Intestinimonas massiliensis (ex Afouda et al. 2020)]MDY5340584.1 hypothetical protein [Intestinimonas sp.]
MTGPYIRRRPAALLAALCLCLALTGCDTGAHMTAFDASSYVSGLLDQSFKKTWSNAWLDLVDLTEGAALDAYEAGLDQEYRRFAYQFDLQDASLTDETRQAARDLLAEICAKAQYTVQSAVALDDERYAVEVKVRSIDLFLQVEADDLSDYAAAFQAAHASDRPDALDDADRSAYWTQYENDWALGVVELCRSKLGLLGYGDVESILVLVAPDDAGNYSMGDNDFANLSALILPY